VSRLNLFLNLVRYIVSRSSAKDLMLLYSLPAFPDKDTNGFLKALARSRNFVRKVLRAILNNYTN
jgi:nuclear GTP-binding protein